MFRQGIEDKYKTFHCIDNAFPSDSRPFLDFTYSWDEELEKSLNEKLAEGLTQTNTGVATVFFGPCYLSALTVLEIITMQSIDVVLVLSSYPCMEKA